MFSQALFLLLISASFCVLTCRDVGASGIINNAFVAVTEFNNQEGTNSPKPDPVRPYRALSQIGLTGDQPTDGYLVSPAKLPRRWRFARIDGNGLWVGADFKNFSSLTKAFPSGSYRLEVTTKSGSPLVTNVHLAPIAFPKAPQILPGDKTAWVGSRLYLTAPSEGATIEWAPAGAGVDEIFVEIKGTEFTDTISPRATNYHIPPALLRDLPTEELVGCLVQFNAPGVSTATTFWLWKPRLWQRSFFAVARGRTFLQTSNANPAPWTPSDAALFDSDFGPFNFAMTGSRPGAVKGPGGRSYPLSFGSPEASIYYSGPYSSQRAVDTRYPNGRYTFGTQSAYLGPSVYPNNGAPIKLLSVNGKPPRWRQGKLLLDAKSNNTVVWSAFQPVKGRPFPTRGLITFSTGYVTEHSTRATDVVEAGLLTGRTTPFNRYHMPEGSLQPGRDHYISIQYLLASFADPKNMSAAGASITTYISVLPLP
jgi:hypothetical protein